jgi:hypothetical protein
MKVKISDKSKNILMGGIILFLILIILFSFFCTHCCTSFYHWNSEKDQYELKEICGCSLNMWILGLASISII